MTIIYAQTDTNANASAIASLCSGASLNADTESCLASDGGSSGSTERTVDVDSSAADLAAVWFEITIAEGVSWDAGTWVVNLNCTSGNHQVTLDAIYICRVNSSYVNQATIGSATGLARNTNDGGLSVNVTGSAQTPDTGDIVVCVLLFDNGNTMGTSSFGWTPNTAITAPFTAGGTDHQLAPAIDAASTVTVTNSLNVGHNLGQTAVDATSDVQAILSHEHALPTAVDATSDVQAILSHEHGLAPTVGATSDVQIVLQSTTEHQLPTAIDAASAVTISLSVDHALVAQVDATSDVQVILQSTTEHQLPTQIDATSTVTVALSVAHDLGQAAVNATSDVQAVLSHEHALPTAIDGTSDVQVVLSHEHGLAPAVDATSDVQVVLSTSGLRNLAPQIDAVSTVTIALSVGHDLGQAAVNATSDVQAVLSHEHAITAQIAATSDVQALLDVTQGLPAQIDAVSTVTFGLSVDHALAIQIDGSGDVQAVLDVTQPVTGPIDSAQQIHPAYLAVWSDSSLYAMTLGDEAVYNSVEQVNLVVIP